MALTAPYVPCNARWCIDRAVRERQPAAARVPIACEECKRGAQCELVSLRAGSINMASP